MSLDEAQSRAAAHLDGPCMVIAGPGSGKTFTILQRIEQLLKKGVRPEEILVITFTRYAAKEMRQRFYEARRGKPLPVTFGTFHGIYYGILRWAYGWDASCLLDESRRYELLEKAYRESLTGDFLREDTEEKKDLLKELGDEISRVANCGWTASYVPKATDRQRFLKICRSYQQLKRRENKIDFDDMLILCRNLLRDHPDILRKWQKRFSYILVDEFQDSNPVQYEVLKLLAAPRNNLFVVGDDDQSIYGFRGAKPHIMQSFLKDFPTAGRICLEVNYRSTAHIVSGASRVIRHNRERFAKNIRSGREKSKTVHIQETRDAMEEGRYVLRKILCLREEGIRAGEIAVLFRTAREGGLIAELLTRQGIPFDRKEQERNLYHHFVGRDLCSYLKLAAGKGKRKDFLRVANRPNRYLCRDALREEEVSYESLRRFYCDKRWMQERISQWEEEMETIRLWTPFAAMEYIRKKVGYHGFLKEYAQKMQLSLEELEEILDEIQQRAKGCKTLEEWFDLTEECQREAERKKRRRREGGEESKADAIRLLTIHGSKGLEFEAVFVIRGNEGSIPSRKARTAEELEEERRLFYVAMTRAKDRLYISYIKEKNGKEQVPSRFVGEVMQAEDYSSSPSSNS